MLYNVPDIKSSSSKSVSRLAMIDSAPSSGSWNIGIPIIRAADDLVCSNAQLQSPLCVAYTH